MALKDYLDLVTSQYRTKPHFMAWLEAALQKLEDLDGSQEQMDYLCSLEVASGNQLDALGLILGVNRKLPFQPASLPSPVMPDPVYRLVLRAQSLKNRWDGTSKGLRDILTILLPGAAIEVMDHQDMTLTYVILSGAITDVERELLFAGYLTPRPEGVRVDYTVYGGRFFGWDSDTELIAGWNIGKWL